MRTSYPKFFPSLLLMVENENGPPNLSKLKKGDLVNVEIDILSKYVKRHLNEKK